MRFVNKDGISTNELREMVDKYSALKITDKNSILMIAHEENKKKTNVC